MDKTFNPRSLDIRAFAQAAAQLQGQAPLADWPRLREESLPSLPLPPEGVRWQLQGHTQPVTGGAPQLGLHLKAQAALQLQCQHCLAPVLETVQAERSFTFVADEATAEALDEDSEADVLVLSRDFDALALVEDELILALPLVPRHAVCPEALPRVAADAAFDDTEAERPHPFAALAALKKER